MLIEINSHNLFSKYFSESAKLVGKVFDEILDKLKDERHFIVILIGRLPVQQSVVNPNGNRRGRDADIGEKSGGQWK